MPHPPRHLWREDGTSSLYVHRVSSWSRPMAASTSSSAYSRQWALVPLALSLVAASTPYLLTHSWSFLGLALHQGFALICHQRAERSFWIFGAPMAVCARCFGIYLGAAVGLLIRTSRDMAFRSLTVAFSLNLLDGVAEATGLHGSWPNVRFVLGTALGATVTTLIVAALQPEEVLCSTAPTPLTGSTARTDCRPHP